MLLNLFLSGAVLLILYEDKGYDYPGVLIYVMALYSFYSTINAVIQIITYRRMGSPVMSTAKVIGIAGIALICSAYPLYFRVTARERQRIAPEILRLTDELMR